MNTMKLIDGTSGKRAPSPARKGLMRAIYDTVDALGGASKQQIRKYLPAAIDDISGLVSTKKLDRAIYSSVYDGYLIHNPDNDKYFIAPIDYYKSRRDWLAKCRERSTPGAHAGKKPSAALVESRPSLITRTIKVLFVLSVTWAFTFGILVGMLIA